MTAATGAWAVLIGGFIFALFQSGAHTDLDIWSARRQAIHVCIVPGLSLSALAFAVAFDEIAEWKRPVSWVTFFMFGPIVTGILILVVSMSLSL